MQDDLSSMSSQQLADPTALDPSNVVRNGATFILPLDAPIPSELGEVTIPTGDLYIRLAALCTPDDDGFRFVPLSGAEMLHLERAWRLLQVAKRVFVLSDLPGARYDVMFTQAARQIGLNRLDWPAVSTTIASKTIANQRTRDTKPWNSDEQTAVRAPGHGNRVQRSVNSMPQDIVPAPVQDDSDANIG